MVRWSKDKTRVRIVAVSMGAPPLKRVVARVRAIVRYGAVIVSAAACTYALTSFAMMLRQNGGPVVSECGVPALSASAQDNTGLSGPVTQSMLPWSTAPPEQLTTLWRLLGSERLVSGFRIPLPPPLWDERQNIATAAAYLQGTIIEPGEVISAIGLTGPYTRQRGYGDGPGYAGGKTVATIAGGVCKVGSALYNVAIYSGLTVVERHPHSMSVSYVPAGRDAAIATGSKDVRLRNDYDKPVLLWSDVHDGTLFIAVYGDFAAPEVIWRHEQVDIQPAPIKQMPNDELPSGQERVVYAGVDGTTVRTAITMTFAGGEPIYRELSVDTYAPVPAIVEYGP